MRKLFFLAMLVCASAICNAQSSEQQSKNQRWSVGTNLIDCANFGTLNLEGSVAVSRRMTINLSTRYNPWTFREYERETQMQNRVRQVALGVRYWPWHVYSGWWIGGRAQYQEYNRGGINKPLTEEGDAFGVGFSFGYTMMLNKHLNMEFGAGLWGGGKSFVHLEYPRYGKVLDTGTTWFVMPNDCLVSLVWIF